MINQGKERIIIRIGARHLSFSTVDPTQAEPTVTYEPYVVKSGMSLPANLREALSDAALQQAGIRKVTVLADTPVLLVPAEQFQESTMEDLFCHAIPRKEPETIHYDMLSDLNAVAVFAINKDLNTVLNDNFSSPKIMPLMVPVWRYLHLRSFAGNRNKLYGYAHDNKLDIFSFQQNRFKFCNQFKANRPQDVLYFLLYVWKQLLLNAENDEMHLAGDLFNDNGQQELISELKRYVQKVYIINPSAEFNRAPMTKVKGLPFDLMTFFMKGK